MARRCMSTDAGFDDVIRRDPARVVLSSHDFDGVPADLDDACAAMRRRAPASIKVAVTRARLTDTLPLLRHRPRRATRSSIGMGDAGVPSRLLAARFGSRWTYAGNGVAPGQIPGGAHGRTSSGFRVGPDTRLFGVVSANAMHSLSPVMHNAAFAAAGIDAVYVPLQAADFEDFLVRVGHGHRGRQRHDSVQARRAARGAAGPTR